MKSTVEPHALAASDLSPLAAARGEVPTSRISWFWHLLNLGPFILLVWFVSRFSVNVPLIDEWQLAYLFNAVKLRQATINDFWTPNYEHRIFLPKLIWTVLAFATHWNLRVEMLANLVPVLITFVVLYCFALRQAKQTGSSLLKLANFSTSLLLFSFMQYETWLWGIVGAFLLVQASVVLAIGVCLIEKLNPWARFGLAAFFCLIASFSSAHGLFSWLALFPCIALLQIGKRKSFKYCLWGLLFAASVALYTYHYQYVIIAEENSPFGFLYHPLRSAAFFSTLLGGPLSARDSPIFIPFACFIGGAILLALLVCMVMLRGYEHKRIVAPWLSIAIFGLIFAAMVTAGRSPIGLIAANQPRYITGTVFVLIAVIHLGRLVCAHKGRQVYIFLVGALWPLLIFGSLSSILAAHQLKEDHSHAKLFLEVFRYMDPAIDGSIEDPVYPVHPAPGIGPPAELLNEIGFIHLASGVVFVDHPSPEHGLFEFADGSGDLMHLRQSKDQVTVSGWASLSGNRGVPKVVMISYGNQKTFITGAVVGIVGRPDIVALRHDPRYLHSGWRVSFPARFLPPGNSILKAWVYDSAEKKFIRLPESGGEKQFKVEAQ